jgi:hypothetical protein
MNEALSIGAADLVGLARPLTAEPYLCKELLAKEKLAAKANYVSPTLQTGASVLQIRQIASEAHISDLSIPEIAQEVEKKFSNALGK